MPLISPFARHKRSMIPYTYSRRQSWELRQKKNAPTIIIQQRSWISRDSDLVTRAKGIVTIIQTMKTIDRTRSEFTQFSPGKERKELCFQWTSRLYRAQTNPTNSLRMNSASAPETGRPLRVLSSSKSQSFLYWVTWGHQQLAKETTLLSKHILACPVGGVCWHLGEQQSKPWEFSADKWFVNGT